VLYAVIGAYLLKEVVVLEDVIQLSSETKRKARVVFRLIPPMQLPYLLSPDHKAQ